MHALVGDRGAPPSHRLRSGGGVGSACLGEIRRRSVARAAVGPFTSRMDRTCSAPCRLTETNLLHALLLRDPIRPADAHLASQRHGGSTWLRPTQLWLPACCCRWAHLASTAAHLLDTGLLGGGTTAVGLLDAKWP